MVKAGDILIAKPFLQDGLFKRSVIYMCEHNLEGSLGFIINKPQGLLLKDIFPHFKNGNFPLFEGGPVSPNQLFYTHTLGSQIEDSVEVSDGVFWGGDFFKITHLIESGILKLDDIRFYIGYSGWQSNQLENEIVADSWLATSSTYNELIKQTPNDVWSYQLTKMNPGYRAFTDFSFDPSLN